MDLKKKPLLKPGQCRRPADVFKKCPRCGCAEMIRVEGDVLCSNCTWDSITLYADALFEQKVNLFNRKDDISLTLDTKNTSATKCHLASVGA